MTKQHPAVIESAKEIEAARELVKTSRELGKDIEKLIAKHKQLVAEIHERIDEAKKLRDRKPLALSYFPPTAQHPAPAHPRARESIVRFRLF